MRSINRCRRTRSMTTIRRATCWANGIRQFYLEAGAGPPVVLLHGFPETSFAWRLQIPTLAPHYRVIAPDLRGYGETDKPSKGYDKRTMANDIVERLEDARRRARRAGRARSRRAGRDPL